MRKVVGLCIYFASFQAFALVIGSSDESVSYSELPEQVCSIVGSEYQHRISSRGRKLYRSYGQGDSNSKCSATIIGANKVITAAHCFMVDKSPPYTLKCPGGIEREINMGNVRAPNPRDWVTQDIAVVELDEPLNIRPVRVAKTYLESRELLKNPTQCISTGYGYAKSQANHGSLRAAPRTRDDEVNFLSFSENFEMEEYIAEIINEHNYAMTGNHRVRSKLLQVLRRRSGILEPDVISFSHKYRSHLRGGDSGGPLLCKDKEEWVLVGVARSSSKTGYDTYLSVSGLYDWVGKYDDDSLLDTSTTVLRVQADHYCRNAEDCIDILSKKSRRLTSDMIEIIDRFDRITPDPGEILLRENIEQLKKSFRELIEDCYRELGA